MKSLNSIIRKKNFIILCIVSITVLALGILYIDATTSVRPRFSKESGFYEDAFYLEMSSQIGGIIYYTLDGSVPDENSIRYEEAVYIDNATKNENTNSMRIDVSTGFRTDLIEQMKTSDADPGYRAPDFLVDKCTVIRAVSISKNGIKSEESSASYFVGIKPEEYDGCRILSLITDSDNLFGSEDGIYVNGDVFEKAKKENELGGAWGWWPANYRMRGMEWEREATFHFFDENGKLKLNKNGGMRIHGGVSRKGLPKSLNLYARNEYDGQDRFDTYLFDNAYSPKRITLAAGGNQLITQFNDYMITERVGDMNFATLTHIPYVLFINGEYWGFYWLNEKYDAEYIEYYYGVNKDNVVLRKHGGIEEGTEEDMILYSKVEEFVLENDMSDNYNYDLLCQMIDIDSYLDYYAVMIYIARRGDWPNANEAMWRSREVTNEKYADGKWRWILFDCNSDCIGTDDTNIQFDSLFYLLEEAKQSSPMFASLWQNATFRNEMKNRIIYVADEYFGSEEMSCFIEEYEKEMMPILSKSWERFYGKGNNKKTEFYNIMYAHKDFFDKRKKEIVKILGINN